MRVIVTRPEAQATAWVARLQALGVDALALPLLGIEPAPDPAAVQAAWAQVGHCALVMFVSANAVTHFFGARPSGLAWPEGVSVGSTGPGTSAALRAAGVPPACIAEPDAAGPFDTEALWLRIRAWPWAGRRVLVVRGEGGRDWLADQLRQAGAELSFVAAYRRVAPALDAAATAVLQLAIDDPARQVWHFSSSEAIAQLQGLAPAADWSRAAALATHPRIAQAAQRAGFGRVVVIGVQPQDVAAYLASVGA